jgi:hypothetical protein
MHSREYRTPERFSGRSVLVVGVGQSGCEIATEIGAVAAKTFLSARRGAHVIPRYLRLGPYDRLDISPFNRLPWPMLNVAFGQAAALSGAEPPSRYGLPPPEHRLLEGLPAATSDLVPALRRGDVAVKPNVERLEGASVRFVDGSEERVDAIVYATGYQLSFPFLAPELLRARGRELPLYRRIVPPDLPGLYFVGLVEAPSGLLPIVEEQSLWIADLLTGRLALPPRGRMWEAIEAAERRTRERFPMEPPYSICCDPHYYRRLLATDRRRARARRSRRFGRAVWARAVDRGRKPARPSAA